MRRGVSLRQRSRMRGFRLQRCFRGERRGAACRQDIRSTRPLSGLDALHFVQRFAIAIDGIARDCRLDQIDGFRTIGRIIDSVTSSVSRPAGGVSRVNIHEIDLLAEHRIRGNRRVPCHAPGQAARPATQ